MALVALMISATSCKNSMMAPISRTVWGYASGVLSQLPLLDSKSRESNIKS
jgi:hypothetical protein